MDRALQFLRRTLFDRTYAPSNSKSSDEIARQHASYIRQIASFSHAFNPLLQNAVSAPGIILNPAALILSLYQKLLVIALAPVRTDSEMIYDTFLPDFKYIIDTCAALIHARNKTNMPPNPRFSLEVGIVPPLHVTAMKCRDPIVRRKAVDLLFLSPRQEGMWDGILTARLGKWVIACEEKDLVAPSLGEREREASAGCSAALYDLSVEGEGLNYPSPPEEVPFVGHDRSANGQIPRSARRNINLNISENLPRSQSPWIVPEENRVQLTVVDFHIPDRYIKVKCQKVLLGDNGEREVREAVIAW